ncbi:MAG: hypothetical protein VX346_12295 [Planctomycetota bacterium]|nr:hypothetical protein [Planctomycetota bacterium]
MFVWLKTIAAAGLLFAAPAIAGAVDEVLAGTRPLTAAGPLDEQMVEGINRFCLRELAAARERRNEVWRRDFTSPVRYAASVAPFRQRFREAIGGVDPRLTATHPNRYQFEFLKALDRSSVIARDAQVTVRHVRWQVLDGVTAEGLLLQPEQVRAAVVTLPDADWTPEMFCGVEPGLAPRLQFAQRLARAGCLVAIPMLISRSDELSGSPYVAYTNQPHREFLYRQAFEMGRHPIGYEVQKTLAAVDLFSQWAERRGMPLPIGVAGVGEGALLAFYAAALDPRIDATLVCGYFQPREGVWQEPIYRNVWGLLREFGDAEIAGMVAPRRLVIEACAVPQVAGPPVVRAGRRSSAAPGEVGPIAVERVRSEFGRAQLIYKKSAAEAELRLAITPAGRGEAGGAEAMAAFGETLGIEIASVAPAPAWQRVETDEDPVKFARRREARQFAELQRHVQTLLRLSPKVRERRWRVDPNTAAAWPAKQLSLRRSVYDNLIGRLPHAKLPPNPRTRFVLEEDRFLGYEVVLDVFPDVIAAGVLLLPKGLKDGEKRPLIVCQHGLEGQPMDTISREPGVYRAYKAFSAELCQRGFIVYAPQNPYRGEDRFRTIQRKSNPLRRSLFSYIIPQHEQTLDWLATLPYVDARRMAFYGISYGGKTAVRVPPMVPRYCLSICSADFTRWVKTIATNEDRYGYGFTREYEIVEWNMGHIASYAELAMLMTPRPFMVEQGHFDGGAPVEWVASEFGKVRRHYDVLGLGERAEIEFFNGGHTINGQGTFRFLHRHLDWPEPAR